MEFRTGILGVEPPVDGGSGSIAFLLQGLDFPAKGRLVGDPPPEAGASQDTKLDLRHPFGKLRTGFSQLPCLGVWWNSSRFTIRRASVAGKAWYRDAGRWVFKLSRTTLIFSTSGYASSTNHLIWWPKSTIVRRSVTSTCRQPAKGSQHMNRLRVPLR